MGNIVTDQQWTIDAHERLGAISEQDLLAVLRGVELPHWVADHQHWADEIKIDFDQTPKPSLMPKLLRASAETTTSFRVQEYTGLLWDTYGRQIEESKKFPNGPDRTLMERFFEIPAASDIVNDAERGELMAYAVSPSDFARGLFTFRPAGGYSGVANIVVSLLNEGVDYRREASNLSSTIVELERTQSRMEDDIAARERLAKELEMEAYSVIDESEGWLVQIGKLHDEVKILKRGTLSGKGDEFSDDTTSVYRDRRLLFVCNGLRSDQVGNVEGHLEPLGAKLSFYNQQHTRGDSLKRMIEGHDVVVTMARYCDHNTFDFSRRADIHLLFPYRNASTLYGFMLERASFVARHLPKPKT